MSKLTIPSEDALSFYQEEHNEIVNDLRFVDKRYYGEWRWGIQYELIVEDVRTRRYYATVVNEQSGDHWYLSLENDDETEFYEVERIEVKTYEYKRI